MSEQSQLSTTSINGQNFDTARLETVSLNRLKAGDHDEAQRLLKAAQSPGFFYLDLQDEQGGKYLDDLQTLYQLGKSYFHQPESLKMGDFRDGEEKGYKPGDAETFEISHDDALTAKTGIPALFSPNKQLISAFISTSHAITKTLLASLSASLHLPEDSSFERSHRDTAPSASGLKLESVPLEERLEDVPPSEHTDMGTLTLLFCEEYTTQLRIPGGNGEGGGEQWAFIVPERGRAIVNVADSLQRISGGALMSCLHRVGQPVAGKGERVCALYYLRPEAGV